MTTSTDQPSSAASQGAGCCSPSTLQTCCAPSDKQDCCGATATEAAPSSCGCRA